MPYMADNKPYNSQGNYLIKLKAVPLIQAHAHSQTSQNVHFLDTLEMLICPYISAISLTLDHAVAQTV